MYGYGNSMFLATHGILARTNAAVLPVNTAAPALSGTAQEGQTLTCSTGTWTGTPTIAYTYQWKRNGSNIGSATNSTYTLVTADVGQSIKCTVTATNGAGSVNADSNTVTPTSAVDPDAQAFITAASITNPTQQSAINQLVVDLKGYNIWTKFKAIYPIVGGVASSHAVNLKTPGTYNLTFATGWTHSSTGMTPNNTYADTFLIPSTSLSLNSTHISFYSRTNTAVNSIEIGSSANTGYAPYLLMQIKSPTNNLGIHVNDGTAAFVSNSDGRGFYVVNRTASNIRNSFKNATKVINDTQASTGLNSNSIWIGAYNTNGSSPLYSNKQCAFASIGNGLTDTDAANFYTAVNAYQVALSRNV